MSKDAKRILLIPSIDRGNGTGHIKRCTALAEGLQRLGCRTAVLADPAGRSRTDCYSPAEVGTFFTRGRKSPPVVTEAVASDWDVCVFDTRRSRASRLNSFNGISLCIGIDEGGPVRDHFDYLIDVLPNLEHTAANISTTGFIRLPASADRKVSKGGGAIGPGSRVLVSFGGEDEHDLTGALLDAAGEDGLFTGMDLAVVEGPLFRKPVGEGDFEVLKAPSDLAGRLSGYDLVITSFGLTCFEALGSGVPVILLNPSTYHRSLSVRAGIPEIGVNHPDTSRLAELLCSPERLYRAAEEYGNTPRLDLASFIAGLSAEHTSKCRGCGRSHHRILYRSGEKSFFRCGNCSLVNQQYFGSDSMSYGKDYFFEDYRRQYGRTYLEDFSRIKSAGTGRVSVIKKIKRSGNLLDIGCGYGAFLSAASDAGFEVSGLDISTEAAAFCSDELGYRSLACSAEDCTAPDFGVDGFDVITMWFVIEHLENPAAILRKVHSMLEPGGVFAFSTPNFDGITRRVDQSRFFSENPLDHHTVWSPGAVRRLLRKSGFRVKYFRAPSVHQERFFKDREAYQRLSGPLRFVLDRLLGAISRRFLLGRYLRGIRRQEEIVT